MSEATEASSEASETSSEASSEASKATHGRAPIDQPPPFWSRWSRIYWVVAGLLLAQTVAFWLLSRWAS